MITDGDLNNEIYPETIARIRNKIKINKSEAEIIKTCKKYSSGGTLNYDQYIAAVNDMR